MPKKLPEFLRRPEAAALIAAAKKDRDRVILLCGLGAGLRCAEICRLRIEHIDLIQSTLFVSQGKGGRDRYVAMPAFLATALRDWIGERNEGWLFPGRKPGQPLTTRAVRYLAERLHDAAGLVRRANPHVWRHSFSCELLRSGATLTDIQALLGHSSPATTAIYLHIDVSRLQSAVDRLDFGQTPAA